MRSVIRFFASRKGRPGAHGTCFVVLCALLFLTFAGCDGRDKAVPVDFTRRAEPARSDPPQAITYAYLPQYSHRVSLIRHHLLVEYLKKVTGLPVRQVFPDTFD